MYCPDCGAENSENDKFCIQCGARLAEPVKEAQDETSADKPQEPKASVSAHEPEQAPAVDKTPEAAKAAAQKASALTDRFKALPKQKKMIFGGASSQSS